MKPFTGSPRVASPAGKGWPTVRKRVLRDGGTYLFVTIAADWRTGHGTRSAYNPHAGAQAWGVCPVGVKSYFQA